MNKKHEAFVSERQVYAFVDFEQPDALSMSSRPAPLRTGGKTERPTAITTDGGWSPRWPSPSRESPMAVWRPTYRNAWEQITEPS